MSCRGSCTGKRFTNVKEYASGICIYCAKNANPSITLACHFCQKTITGYFPCFTCGAMQCNDCVDRSADQGWLATCRNCRESRST